jgi:hypothetical protein
MLEALARTKPLADDTSLRAALYLARNHGRHDLREALEEVAGRGRREELRGMAAAALWDVATPDGADSPATTRARLPHLVDELLDSRIVGNVAWGALIRAASKGGAGLSPLLTESPFRWIQWGWLE